MSFFSKYFKSSNSDIEKDLEDSYSLMLERAGFSPREARISVKEAIKLCKKQIKEEGDDRISENYGDFILRAAESGDPEYKKFVLKLYREGVVDDDIREFWNLHPLQRKMIVWSENVHRTTMAISLFNQLTESGQTSEDEKRKAGMEIRKTFPMYGDPDNTRVVSGDDRPLPDELRGRVDRWRLGIIEKEGAEGLKGRLSKYSTFNAMIRDELRKGNL